LGQGVTQSDLNHTLKIHHLEVVLHDELLEEPSKG